MLSYWLTSLKKLNPYFMKAFMIQLRKNQVILTCVLVALYRQIIGPHIPSPILSFIVIVGASVLTTAALVYLSAFLYPDES
jgi:hypothetical protein